MVTFTPCARGVSSLLRAAETSVAHRDDPFTSSDEDGDGDQTPSDEVDKEEIDEEEEEDGAVTAALALAELDPDSDEEMLESSHADATSTSAQPKRRQRRPRQSFLPLTPSQAHNLALFFDMYCARLDAARRAPLAVGCEASYKPAGGRRIYGTICAISHGTATLTRSTIEADGRRVATLMLPQGDFRRRVPKLSKEEASEVADNCFLLGGVNQLRAEYRHYMRVVRRLRIVEQFHRPVLDVLRSLNMTGKFTFPQLTSAAQSVGLTSNDGAVILFLHLRDVLKVIKKRNGAPTRRMGWPMR